MKKSKVLLIDIETSIMTFFGFRTGKQWVTYKDIDEDWRILSYCAKWIGDKKIVYEEARTEKSEKKLVKNIKNLLDQAHIVVTHNGTIFDGKRINTRLIINNIPFPSVYRHFDTHSLVRRVADFTSTSLHYLTHKLGSKHQKLSHKKFPGKELWKECRKNNPEAWAEMKKYNIIDVKSLEDLYLKLRKYAPESFPKEYELTDESSQCGVCGYEGSMKEGNIRKANKYKYKQYSCPKCGSWQKGKRIM